MNLTVKLKARIVEMFLGGTRIGEFVAWYDKSASQIEQVIREGLKDALEPGQATTTEIEQCSKCKQARPCDCQLDGGTYGT